MNSNSSYNNQSEETQLIETSKNSLSPPPSYEHVLGEVSDTLVHGEHGKDAVDKEKQSQVQRPQIIHKSSKEFYKAVAAQWGITCKMSDHCRCLECQVCRTCFYDHYLDCEYDYDEQEKTDGGLGAGTPMFLSEVMHGSACSIL